MTLFQLILLLFLVVCAVSVSFSRNLLNSVLIYMSFSLIMSIVWLCLESPDLAITEAAVGAGVTSILFFATLKKIHAIEIQKEHKATEPETEKEWSGKDE
ncbi:MAG: hydrogenase subunit MbhD domain-containing protein [Acetatifactor sp.]|nr:hydrogenase subunit MbhD domain-containing protein [Acetatifactor sp.]